MSKTTILKFVFVTGVFLLIVSIQYCLPIPIIDCCNLKGGVIVEQRLYTTLKRYWNVYLFY